MLLPKAPKSTNGVHRGNIHPTALRRTASQQTLPAASSKSTGFPKPRPVRTGISVKPGFQMASRHRTPHSARLRRARKHRIQSHEKTFQCIFADIVARQVIGKFPTLITAPQNQTAPIEAVPISIATVCAASDTPPEHRQAAAFQTLSQQKNP